MRHFAASVRAGYFGLRVLAVLLVPLLASVSWGAACTVGQYPWQAVKAGVTYYGGTADEACRNAFLGADGPPYYPGTGTTCYRGFGDFVSAVGYLTSMTRVCDPYINFGAPTSSAGTSTVTVTVNETPVGGATSAGWGSKVFTLGVVVAFFFAFAVGYRQGRAGV
jgi:hypothetical protein